MVDTLDSAFVIKCEIGVSLHCEAMRHLSYTRRNQSFRAGNTIIWNAIIHNIVSIERSVLRSEITVF